MNSRFLREAAKVGVGLVIGDMVCGIWLAGAGLLPLTFLGVTWTTSALAPGFVLDISLIILLAHFGWNTHSPIKSRSERPLLRLVGLIFLLLALAHLARIAFGWNFMLGSVLVPVWISWLGVIAAAFLSYASFHFAKRK